MRVRTLLILPFALLLAASVPGTARETAAAGTRFVADGGIVGAPVVTDGGAVYCATDARSLIRVDADTGFRWNVPLRGMPASIFMRRDGVLLLCLDDGRISAYNPRGGEGPEFRAGTESPTAVFETADGRILTSDASGGFGLFTPGGLKLLTWSLSGKPSSLPAFGGEDLVACAVRGGGIEVRTAAGTLAARIPTAFEAHVVLMTAGGTLAAGGADGTVGLFSRDGGELARRSFASPVIGLYSLPGEGFAALTEDGEAVFFDAGGKIKRSHEFGGAVLGAAVDGAGLLYVAGKQGGLAAFSEEGPVFSDPSIRFLLPPSVSAGGAYLAAGGSDWVLHLFEIIRYRSRGNEEGFRVRPGTPAVPAPKPAETRFAGDLDLIYLLENARSDSPTRRARVLDELEERLAKADLGKSADYVSLPLRLLATGDETASGRAEPSTEFRLRAIRLLGLLGSGLDRGFLAGLLGRETDETARAEIVGALGELRSDPEGTARNSVCRACLGRSLPARLAGAGIGALEKLLAYNGGPLRQEEVSFLERILTGGYARGLKARAAALGSIR